MSQSLKITADMQRFAEEQIDAGNFTTVDEVAQAAFSLLKESAQRRDVVREELGALFDELDAGKGIPTTDDEFGRMVHARAAKYARQ